MSKDLLNKIRGAIDKNESAEPVKPAVDTPKVDAVDSNKSAEAKPEKPASPKSKATSKGRVPQKAVSAPGITGFEELQQILKAEKESFQFNRRLVYVDENIGEILDLLRKEAKINSNVLASYLFKQFFLENKELIKSLREKRKDSFFFD